MTLRINPARAALLLLDYQNYNVHPDGYWAQAIPGSAERAAPAVARTAEVLEAARRAGIMVIHIQNAWREGHPDVKRAVSGFAGTELDRLLHIHDLSTLVIAGIVTNFAAEGTARDASDRGYRVIVLADCGESVTDEMHEFSITQIMPAIGEVVDAADFIEWESARRRHG